MMSSSPMAKSLALSAAAALHGAVIWGLGTDAETQIEGAAGTVEASIGSSFADMAAGTIRATRTREVIRDVSPDALHETAPLDVTHATPPDPVTGAEPQLETRTALLPEPVLPPEQAQEATEPAPKLQTSESAEVIAPEENPASVTRSLRPKSRNVELAKQAKPPEQQRGNAAQNAVAGSATGTKRTTAKAAGAGASQQKTAGNAAASNYPGKVMKKISRVPKPRVGSKGTSVVAFTIAPGGGLSAVSLARSSGSAGLDRAALRVVRRAAPFPPPPAGARRSFSINIRGG